MKKTAIFITAIFACILFTIIACKKDTSSEGSATITALTCASTTFSATATISTAYSGTATVPYTGGNSVAYSAGTSIASTGVTGLTATLAAGTLSSSGNLTYTITGTPTTAGTASFAITFGGQSCSMSLVVNASTSTGATVTALTCTSTVFSAASVINTAYTGTATVPYTGGNGMTYTAGTAIASTGVTGLTATLVAGTLASGAGNITYNITGTPTSAGTASFAITFGGQTCSMSLAVTSTVATSCTNATTIASVISKITAFEALLSTTQLATFNQTRTKALAINWSNLPCGAQCRNGLEFNTLTAAQLTAALSIVQAATGTEANQGYDQFMQIRAADDILLANSTSGGYSSGYYFICVLGTPSTTGVWQLQYGGHHTAVNVTYSSSTVAGATPLFEGVEPKSWTTSGTTYTPLDNEHTAMVNMLASLTTTQLASAKLSTTFSDVLLGPNTDGQFPATKAGVAVSTLTTAQQALVTTAIKMWVGDVDATTAACLMTTYTSELSSTYIAYSTDATLSTNTAYVRIDGPSVWIEFVCQSGVVFSSQIHYHSVWRDHTRDYGGTFTF